MSIMPAEVPPAPLPDGFGVELTPDQFEARFLALHRQLYASSEFEFAAVTRHIYRPPAGYYQVDHSLFHDGQRWHLFYCTGQMRNTDAYTACMARGDWQGAAQNTVEPGIGHAAGADLADLQFVGLIEPVVQGDFDLITRSNGWAFCYGGRYGMIYGVRGVAGFVGFSLMWSDDLETWQPGAANPIFRAPAWAASGATCKDVHVYQYDGQFLLYYITSDRDGYCCIALCTTQDWQSFTDRGPVFRAAPMLRGTMGVESPTVCFRDGLWHLFFTYGPGLCHAVSRRPDQFVQSRGNTYNVGTGYYPMGAFHATEVLQDAAGDWWLTTDRKEETRRLNRQAGRLCYRGSYEDEKTLEEGLYLSRLHWQGDQPILQRPAD